MSAQALGNFEKNLHYILTFDRPKITQLMTTHNECIEYMRESGRQLMNGTSGKVSGTLSINVSAQFTFHDDFIISNCGCSTIRTTTPMIPHYLHFFYVLSERPLVPEMRYCVSQCQH